MSGFMRRHIFALVLLVLIIGLSCGWAVGTATTCVSASCHFDASLFGAWGSWIGGIATAGATIAAAAAFKSERADRRAKWASRRAEIAATARTCVLRAQAISLAPDGYRRVKIQFDNNTKFDVTDLAVYLEDGSLLDRDDQVNPGHNWAEKHRASTFQSNHTLGHDRVLAAETIRSVILPSLTFEFTIATTRFRRRGTELTELGLISA